MALSEREKTRIRRQVRGDLHRFTIDEVRQGWLNAVRREERDLEAAKGRVKGKQKDLEVAREYLAVALEIIEPATRAGLNEDGGS